MDAAIYKKLKEFGNAKANVPLSKFTTYKIGGPADTLLEITEREQLPEALNFLAAEGVDFFILGGGSNTLFRDQGFSGVVIKVRTGGLSVINNTIEADAGLSTANVALAAVKAGLSGFEWSAGLPGTIGGAVRGNAGAAGGETASVVKKVEAWIDGEVLELKPDECKFDYRHSIFKTNGVVLRAWFELVPGDPKTSLIRMQEINRQRAGKYPSLPSAGCFFKNVPLDRCPNTEWREKFKMSGRISAGFLIDQVGLKGLTVGGAMISKEHGNFIVNANAATAADILTIVEEVKAAVYNKLEVELEEEVHIVN